MKALPLLSILMLPASVSVAQEEALPAEAQQAPADREAAVQYLLNTVMETLLMLEAVHDRASADAAAERLAEVEQQLTEVEKSCGISQADLRHEFEKRGMTGERFMAVFDKLNENRCYGSEALADMLGCPGEDDICDIEPEETEPLPAEIQKLLEQTLEQVAARYTDCISGGPGLSRDTAWVLSDKAPHRITQEFCQALPQSSTRLVIVSDGNGADYVCLCCMVELDGEVYFPELWFRLPETNADAYYPVNPLEEEPTLPEDEALADEMTSNIVQMLGLLEEINDKASADAAAPGVKQLMVRISEIGTELNASDIDLYARCEKNGFSTERIFAIHEKIAQQRCYGSLQLADALGLAPYVALEPQELTPEARAAAEPYIRQAVQQLHRPVSGGPGFSQEDAWLPAPADTPFDIADVISALPEGTFTFFSMGMDAAGASRRYEHVNLFFLHEEQLYRVSIYFDITACADAEESE